LIVRHKKSQWFLIWEGKDTTIWWVIGLWGYRFRVWGLLVVCGYGFVVGGLGFGVYWLLVVCGYGFVVGGLGFGVYWLVVVVVMGLLLVVWGLGFIGCWWFGVMGLLLVVWGYGFVVGGLGGLRGEIDAGVTCWRLVVYWHRLPAIGLGIVVWGLWLMVYSHPWPVLV
jgi:hypothetical protein